MDLKNLKIKYMLGSFRDDPSFPTIEDFEYFYSVWMNDSYKVDEINSRKTVIQEPGQYFLYNYLFDSMGNNKEKTDEFINKLVESGNIVFSKVTLYKILKF